jgi:hypothetical protein
MSHYSNEGYFLLGCDDVNLDIYVSEERGKEEYSVTAVRTQDLTVLWYFI